MPLAVDGATRAVFSAAVATVQSGIFRRHASRVRSYERSARFDATAVAFALRTVALKSCTFPLNARNWAFADGSMLL